MEVAVAEEKKKIFRARKTMKVSDRQQLETLHNTLSPSGQPSSNSSSPLGPLLNGTHKEDGRKGSPDKELNDTDSKSPRATTPVSPSSRGSRSSPAPSLTLKLSPSPPPNQSPKYNNTDAAAAAPSSPASPFHSLNFELKKMEEEGKKVCSPPPSNGCPASPLKEAKECRDEPTEATDQKKKDEDTMEIQKEETKTKKEDLASDSSNDSKLSPPASPATSDRKSDKDQESNQEDNVAMETDNENSKPKTSDASSVKEDETSSLKPTSSSSPPSASQSASSPVPEKDQEIKEVEKDTKRDENEVKDVKLKSSKEEKMEVDDKVKSELIKEEVGGVDSKSSRPSSTPPSGIVKEEKRNPTGLKRTLSEGDEKDGIKVERDGKRSKVQGVELEAQLELKITAKPGSRLKLEKVVQQMVEERLKELQLTVFDQSFQELKDRVEKIDCANRHQSTILTLQAKVARLAKKFGEANQASENKKKQQVPNVTTPVAKTTATVTTAPPLRLVRTSTELKQIPATPVSTNQTAMLSSQAQPKHTHSSTTTSSAAMVTQSNILQLISTSAANASTLGTITSQSPAGTLLLKTTPGGAMMNQGQPLLIQLPLSMTNGQPGTLVNIPVSSFAAPGNNNNPLNKGKANAPATSTATFIIKASPSSTLTNTTASATSSSVPMLQASTVQISPSQMSVPRTIYQGGAGGISTPNAGVVSVTSARTPVHTVSVAGAMSSSSSPAASGPAATGSAAPGPPKGTALTSKTDNQATGSTPTKTAVPGSRPKGSVIDLTEDDDDVQVTGVTKKVTLATTTPSAAQRNSLQITIPTGTAARSSPQSLQSSASNPNLTVHHRPQLDSPLKARSANTGTPTSRTATSSSMGLPPLPSAPPLTTRLPPEAQQTSPPQQPQLKLVQGQNGIVLSWCVSETDRNCAAVESYHLYAYHNDNSSSGGSASAPQQQQQQQHWKKIGEVKALPLPMACTLTQFQSGSTYHFAVRARDVYGRFGSFCEPQCTNVINSS